MIMKIGLKKVKFRAWIRTVEAHTGDTFVELDFAVLEILKEEFKTAMILAGGKVVPF